MKDKKLTLPFCLHAIADSIEHMGCLFLRVGPVLLDYDGVGNVYEVFDKNGSMVSFTDLVAAINKFIDSVNMI